MASWFRRCFGAKSLASSLNLGSADQPQILVLGLDQAGKTTLLYRLKLGDNWNAKAMTKDLAELRRKRFSLDDKDGRKGDRDKDKDKDKGERPQMILDPGYHYEEFTRPYCGMWDIPGSSAMRQTWNIFYRNIKTNAVIFVVGCEDKMEERLIDEKIETLTKDMSKDPMDKAKEDQELRQKLEKAKKYTETRRNLAKKVLHILMNEDELSHACFAVVLNQRRVKKINAPENNDDELHYRLGLKDLHESLKTRVQTFTINLNEIEGEYDPKFKEVWNFIKNHGKTVADRSMFS